MKSKIYFYIFLNQCKIKNKLASYKIKDKIIIKKYNYLLSYAFKINNFDLVKFAINKGTDYINEFEFENVIKNKNYNIINYIYNKNLFSKFNLNDNLELSTKYKNLDLIQLFIKYGANEYYHPILIACKNNSLNIVQYFFEISNQNDENDLEKYIIKAIENNNIEIVKFLLIYHNKFEDFVFKDFISSATYIRNTEIIDLILLYCSDISILNTALIRASILNYIEIVKLMIQYGANDFNSGLINASYFENIRIVKIMLDNGADNYKESISFAKENKNNNIIKLINKYKK